MGSRVFRLVRFLAIILTTYAIAPGSAQSWNWPHGPILLGPGEPMKIVTLDAPQFGLDTRNAVDLAVQHFGGKIGGHPIRTRHTRFGCDPAAERHEKFLEKITENSRVVGVIGPICSGVAVRQVPVLSDAEILVISPANTAAELTSPEFHKANPYYYRTAPSDIFQGEAGGDFASAPAGQGGLGAASAVILYYPDDQYSDVLRENFKRGFTGTIAGEFPIEFGQEDFSEILSQIEALNVGVVYAPLFDELEPFFFQLRGLGGSAGHIPILAPDSWFFTEIFEILGPDPEAFYASSFDFTGPKFEAFYQAYVSKYGREPNAFEPLAYDATRLMLKAIAAKSIKIGKVLYLNPKDLLRYLEKDSNYPFEGAGGVYYDPVNGDLNPRASAVYRAAGGDFTQVYPQ